MSVSEKVYRFTYATVGWISGWAILFYKKTGILQRFILIDFFISEYYYIKKLEDYMSKFLKIFMMAIVSLSFLVACGGGSSSVDDVTPDPIKFSYFKINSFKEDNNSIEEFILSNGVTEVALWFKSDDDTLVGLDGQGTKYLLLKKGGTWYKCENATHGSGAKESYFSPTSGVVAFGGDNLSAPPYFIGTVNITDDGFTITGRKINENNDTFVEYDDDPEHFATQYTGVPVEISGEGMFAVTATDDCSVFDYLNEE